MTNDPARAFAKAVLADPAVIVTRFSTAITEAVMASIDRATCDQPSNATLDARSLRQAVYLGIAGYLRDEIGKSRQARADVP